MRIGRLLADDPLRDRGVVLLEDPPAVVGHPQDGHRLDLVAAAGEDVVRGGHLVGGDLEGAEGDGGIGLDRRAAAQLLRPQPGDALVAHHLRHLHRGHVEALGQGPPQGHEAEVLVLVVLRDVLLVLVEEDRRRVLHHGGRGDRRQAGVLEGGLEGGEVHEGLEGAPGLAPGLHHPVVLALPVGAAPDQGHHLAAQGLDGDERALDGLVGPLLDHLLDVVEALLEGPLGDALQVQVEGGVDREVLGREVVRVVVLAPAAGGPGPRSTGRR